MRSRVVARNVGRKVAKGTLIACLLLPLATYVIYVKGKTRIYNSKLKTRLKRRDEAAPTPLSTREQTQATIRECATDIKLQEQSILFRLPAEIRIKIYEELLSDKTFHIERGNKRLIHTNCNQGGINSWDCGCGRSLRAKDEPWKLFKDSDCKSCGSVPILQTCRRIYDEAASLLYTRNRFVFSHLDSLRYFSEGILPNQLAFITSIQLSWSFAVPWYNETPSAIPESRYAPYDEISWMNIWRTISTFRGLKELRLRIYDSPPPKTAQNEAMILAPLKMVDRPKTFAVYLPWHGFNAPELPVPFQITRVCVLHTQSDS